MALDPPADWTEFRTWIDGTGQAVFLLDSVDEARLKGKDFGRALRRLAGELGTAQERATVLVSCRVSDWQAHADRRTVEECLPPPARTVHGKGSSTPGETPVRVFAFAPLDDGQVRRLCVEVHGLPDVDAFLRDVRDAQGADFLHRPRDVEWMVGHWRSTGRIGSLTDILDTNVRKKLAEPRHLERPRHADLWADRLTAGARSLAAAVTFVGKAALRLPDHGAIIDAAADALDPAEVLTGWTDAERRELLSRALFDEATYGRLRFHHRSVVEHLTARWLSDRLDQGCPTSGIEELLFPTLYGHRYDAPLLAAAAGWLAGWNDRIRALARRIAPAILIQHGDPRTLPVDCRAAILTEAVERLHAAPHEDDGISDEALERFAAPELEPTVRALHDRFGRDQRVTELLLRVIRHGRITGCADIALAAVSDGRSRTQRGYGLFALETVGDVADKLVLAERLVADAPSWDEASLGRALTFCLPDGMTAERFLHIIGAVMVPDREFGEYGAEKILTEIAIHRLPRGWLSDLLGLLLSQTVPVEDDGYAFAHCIDLRTAMARILVRVLRELGPSEFREGDIVRSILFLNRKHRKFHDTEMPMEAVREAVGSYPTIKKALFWQTAAEMRSTKISFFRPRTFIGRGESYWTLDESDLTWLLDDLKICVDPEDRSLALYCVMTLWSRLERPIDLLPRIRAAIDGVEELTVEMARWLDTPPPRKDEAWEEWDREREEAEAASMEAARASLLARLAQIRSGEAIEAVGHLLRPMTQSRLSWTQTDTSSLVPLFGEAVAEAVRMGLKVYWRERAKSAGGGVLELILSGLALDMKDGLDPGILSDAEARFAARAVLRTSSGFPPWFETLANAKTVAVRETILSAVRREWTRVEDDDLELFSHPAFYPSTFGRLESGPAAIRDLVAADVFAWLKRKAPANLTVTRAAVRLAVMSDAVSRDRLATLAACRTRETRDDCPRLTIWLPLWLGLDGPAALDFLEEELAGLSAEQAVTLVMDLCRMLRGDFRQVHYATGDLPKDVPSLARIVAVLFRHIRVAEDNEHGRCVYTPDRRDHAEEVRNTALRRLADIPGKATHDALLALAGQFGNTAAHLWFRRLAARRAAADGDPAPWTPGAVMAFERDNEAMPASPADLHRIAMRRLTLIREDLEGGDFSVRGLFGKHTDEADVQAWLAGVLRDRANRRYSVHREEQVDRSKRTDIRLHNAAFDGPVCIEIKVMEKGWTVQELEAALGHQLGGQHLRDHRSRHGVLLLFRAGVRKTWHRAGVAPLGFEQLLDHLRTHAADLARRHPGVDRLDVVGMDAGDPA